MSIRYFIISLTLHFGPALGSRSDSNLEWGKKNSSADLCAINLNAFNLFVFHS